MSRRSRAASAPSPDGYSYDELLPLVLATLQAGASVLVRGHPGVGKSSLAGEIATELGLPLHDIRLAQREPAEIGGVYFPDREKQELDLLPPPWVRSVCEAPGLVFLDEVNAAVTRLHQAAAYQIVLEKRVGPFRFHPDTVVMAAGNLEEDEALVTPLSSALNNRFVHFTLKVDLDCWLAWAERAQLSPVILSYIRSQRRFGAELLYANDGSEAFPTPRSWAVAARLYDVAPEVLRRRLVAAAIGVSAAEKLFGFVRLFHKVRPRKIVANGVIPDFDGERSSDPSFAHAVVTAVSSWLTNGASIEDAWLPNLVRFARAPGLDPEYAFLFLRALRARSDLTERLKTIPEYRALADELVQLHAGLYR